MIQSTQSHSFASPIPLSAPHLVGRERDYVNECLSSGWVSSAGPFVDRFESEIAQHALVGHAVATTTGTSALHLALLTAGIQPGDAVITSDLTFIAPVNAIRYVGAHPILIDADPAHWQIDVRRMESFLTQECTFRGDTLFERATDRPVRAILPAHILGHPVDIDAIRSLAKRFHLILIEDAAEGVGADYKGRPVGQTDDLAIYSFNGNKIVTAGGGGALLTDRADWAERARYLSTQAKLDAVEAVHGEVGFNYRLTNLQAAVGLAQLEQLEEFVSHKRAIARRYAEQLGDLPGITLMPEASWARSTFWLYTILVDADRFGMGSRDLAAQLSADGIQTRPIWKPMHLNRPHAEATRVGGEVAEKLHRESISLPSSAGLDLEVVDDVAQVIRRQVRRQLR